MDEQDDRTSALPSVAVGVLLGVAAIGLLIVSAEPWRGVVLVAILGGVAFCGICLWSAYAGASVRGAQAGVASQVLVWAERAVLSLVPLGMATLVAWTARGSGSGDATVVLLVLGAGAILGALLGPLPRVLLAVEGAMCAGYAVWGGWILLQAVGCWDCREGDLTEGGYAIIGLGILTFWLVTFLGGVTAGAIARRLLR